jgi:phage-related protein
MQCVRAVQVISIAAAVLLSTTTAAFAHHSFAVYDHTKTLTLRGTVTKFQWTNPHAYLEMDVKQADGSVKHYSVELTSINMMQRVGWRSNMVKAGDQVTAVIAPILTGEPVGLGLEVTLADGTKKELPVPAAASFKRTTETQ